MRFGKQACSQANSDKSRESETFLSVSSYFLDKNAQETAFFTINIHPYLGEFLYLRDYET